MKMRHSITSVAIALPLLAGSASVAFAQALPAGSVGATLPPSSIATAADIGQRFHTNLEILGQFSVQGALMAEPLFYGPPFPGYFYETPASLACIYDLVPPSSGCNPNLVKLNPSGGSKAIAVVDAYDDPNAYTDLQTFSGQFGVAAINPTSFVVVYAPPGGAAPGSCVGAPTRPPSAAGTGWDVEISLDIEYAHAMAPYATLYLVEAQSDYLTDLFCAVSVASKLVKSAGGGEVSNSWGSGEFSGETAYDSVFTTANVVYFAGAGDSPGAVYPSTSPNVVSVGGTSTSMNPVTGNFISESTWQDGGGGASVYEPKPSYQSGIAGSYRQTPDIASDANPYTGVWVRDTLTPPYAWYIVGGTSASTPTWAGIVNTAGNFFASTKAELTKLYGDAHGDFNAITIGNCGLYISESASASWNSCTGLGSPKGYGGK
jgi:kumamolisin